MKKIILNKKVSEIHKGEITENDVIIAKRKGKTIGSIIYGSHSWISTSIGEGYQCNNSLDDAFSDSDFDNCEFFVID